MRILYPLLLLCSLVIPASGITLVQHNSANGTAVTSLNVTFTSNVTAGNLIWVFCRTGAGTLSMSDSLGNAYTLVTSIKDGTGGGGVETGEVWYAKNITGGADTVTCTCSGSANLGVIVHEYSGLDKVNPLDQQATGNGSGTSMTTSSVTTTNPNEVLVVGCVIPTSSDTFTAGSGYTLEEQIIDGANKRGASEDQIVTSVGSVSGAMTQSASQNWGCILSTLQAPLLSGRRFITY